MGGIVTAPDPRHANPVRPVPPPGGHTVDDLDRLPNLPPHTELIDGSLVFLSPRRDFHSLAVDLIAAGLRQTAPEGLRVKREMTVVLTEQTAPEPDVIVVRADAVHNRRQTRYQAKDVLLAVEVVSPESAERDRETKPLKYARAGIPHFWRVEMAGPDDHPVVYTFERDPRTAWYSPTGVYQGWLKADEPYRIDLDLTEIDRM
ncbi:Uma2 family endonuclease [Streptomyces sp. DSM 44915]|uniref:Uma2 family endonuclease n=1 Tax=Streptomyces chisholmiae TaxID=3075540 RepID=A0ABU2JJR4_9ACTN|nr:Uma2 family endonuclease [Streptomyces sp. DSM 44915]MDT0265225.1 Uma2 family endonuclease [Streptomyces sp. DSM 44915]